MARMLITGDKEIEKTLRQLSDKGADKVTKSAVSGGLGTMASAIRKEAPKGKTGNLKKAIGKRFEKSSNRSSATAKAGINVGKQKTADRINGRPVAPHNHLVALGTANRTRKKIGGRFSYLRQPTAAQLSTGSMPANPFVRFAVNKSATRVKNMMRSRAARALIKQAKLAASRGG